MDEKEELKQKLQEELNWVKYRHNMLGIIEVKLLQMKQLAKQAKEENLSTVEIETLNARINNLAMQVNTIDEQSKNIEYEEKIE
jgi:hypothetical protein